MKGLRVPGPSQGNLPVDPNGVVSGPSTCTTAAQTDWEPPRGMPDRKELDSFIGTSFRSVWALELLKYLAENPGTYHTSDELIAVLRASEAVVSQSVQNLA